MAGLDTASSSPGGSIRPGSVCTCMLGQRGIGDRASGVSGGWPISIPLVRGVGGQQEIIASFPA